MWILAMLMVTSAATAEPSRPAWSLLPQPAGMHPAGHGSVTVSDGDRVLVQAAGDAQALAVVRRFAALVADTRGLHLRVEPRPKSHRSYFASTLTRMSRAMPAIGLQSAMVASRSRRAQRAVCSTAA